MRWKVPTWLAGLASIVIGVTALGTAPLQAQDPDLSWPPSVGYPGQIGFVIEDSWLFSNQISVASPGDQPVCSSMNDPACTRLAERYGWWILRVAPPCTRALAWEECVGGISLRGSEGTWRDLDFTGLAPGSTFAADEGRGLPTGSTMSLFRDPTATDPSLRYAVYLGGQMGGKNPPFRFNEFAAQIIPYRVVPEGLQPRGGNCLWRSGGRCAYRVAFPDETEAKLSLRLSNTVTGWLGGRLMDPSITVEPLGRALNRLTVSAGPVEVPLVAFAMPDAQATPEILDYWRSNFTCPGNVPCTSGVMSGQSSGPSGADQLRLFADLLGDTATRVIPTWSVSNLPNRTGQACLSDTTRLVGLVTTNATIYDASPPQFAASRLRYRVAALHRVPGGEVMRGSYNLALRSDVARCLYGFSDAPVVADISVTSPDGVEQVATTGVAERDGWLYLSARGFTFSQPTISVKLSTTAPAVGRFATCKAMNKVYRDGVMRPRAANVVVVKGKRWKRPALGRPHVSAEIYAAHRQLDRDRDGLVCEREPKIR